MNIYVKILLLIFLNYLCYIFAGFWLGLIASCIIVYKILSYFGITRVPNISEGHFVEGLSFTKDYFGSYKNHQKEFMEACQLIQRFKLKDFIVIALYYDSPNSVEENKLRSSIGIYTKNKDSIENITEEFEKYCEENGYNKNELPNSRSLFCNWEYFNFVSMIIGVQKFYKLMDKNLKDDSFKKTFRIDESKIKASIEVYELDHNSMCFYIPLINGDKFMLFKKDK